MMSSQVHCTCILKQGRFFVLKYDDSKSFGYRGCASKGDVRIILFPAEQGEINDGAHDEVTTCGEKMSPDPDA